MVRYHGSWYTYSYNEWPESFSERLCLSLGFSSASTSVRELLPLFSSSARTVVGVMRSNSSGVQEHNDMHVVYIQCSRNWVTTPHASVVTLQIQVSPLSHRPLLVVTPKIQDSPLNHHSLLSSDSSDSRVTAESPPLRWSFCCINMFLDLLEPFSWFMFFESNNLLLVDRFTYQLYFFVIVMKIGDQCDKTLMHWETNSSCERGVHYYC